MGGFLGTSELWGTVPLEESRQGTNKATKTRGYLQEFLIGKGKIAISRKNLAGESILGETHFTKWNKRERKACTPAKGGLITACRETKLTYGFK